MAQLRWFQGFLLMILQLTVTAEQISVIKRAGDEVTLPCSKLVDQQKCSRNTWIFSESGYKPGVELVKLGEINKTRHERLSLTAKCSLVIKKVKKEDAGRFICQQWKQGNDKTPVHQSSLDLSVTYMTEQRVNQKKILSCSVVTSDPCRYKVMWFYQDNNKENPPETDCSATVTLSPGSRLPQCKVTLIHTNEVFTFIHPSSEKPGKVQPATKPENRNPVTTKPKTDNVSPTSTGNPVTTKTTPASRVSTASVTTTMTPGTNSRAIPFIAVPVVIVVVLAAAGLIIRWRAKGKKTGTDENAVKLEDNVAYATIRHAKGTKRKAKVAVNHDAVTYSTVTSCPSGATSEYPQNIYSIIVSNN